MGRSLAEVALARRLRDADLEDLVRFDNWDAYESVAARALGAEVSTVAISGRGVYRNADGTTDGTMPKLFDRILAATRHCTTILISHRFSTVRHADRICVLEHGRVIELGTHDELMAQGGRYRTMFDLQAQRFSAPDEGEGITYDVLS